MISVVIPIRGEDPEEVHETKISFMKAGVNEIVTVQDPEGNGPAWARNLGYRESRGDIILFSDAHVRWDYGSLIEFAGHAFDRRIVCAPVMSLETKRCTYYGADFGEDPEYPGYKLIPSRKERTSCTCLYGSVYAISRKTLDYIGGWPPTIGWGYNEQSLSLLCQAKNVPIYIDTSCRVLHRFRSKFPYKARESYSKINRIIAHHGLSTHSEWVSKWLPSFSKTQYWKSSLKYTESHDVGWLL